MVVDGHGGSAAADMFIENIAEEVAEKDNDSILYHSIFILVQCVRIDRSNDGVTGQLMSGWWHCIHYVTMPSLKLVSSPSYMTNAGRGMQEAVLTLDRKVYQNY